jgi:hypothetical protein
MRESALKRVHTMRLDYPNEKIGATLGRPIN